MSYKKLIAWILVTLTLTALLCSCGTGYVCEFGAGSDRKTVSGLEGKIDHIDINGKTYELTYEETYASELTGELIDEYRVSVHELPEIFSLGTHCVHIERESGKLISFSGILPYAIIQNISDMTDDEIKTTVEEMLSADYDFSLYDKFEHAAPIGDHYLTWSVEGQNISLSVDISEDGDIFHVFQTNAGADASDILSLDEAERDAIILKCLKKQGVVKSTKDVKMEIRYATQTMYKGKPAVVYGISVDKDGFPSVHVVTIYSKKSN